MKMEVCLEVVGGGGGGHFAIITCNVIDLCTQHLTVLFSYNFQTLYFKDINKDGGLLEVVGGGGGSQFVLITCNDIDFCTQHLVVCSIFSQFLDRYIFQGHR